MKREINTKFFTFDQNNSGGYYIVNDEVAEYLIIEAGTADEAVAKMRKITEDYSSYCPCCGRRWCDWMDEEDGTDVPTIFGRPAKEETQRRTIIHYYDGTREKLYY